MIDSDVIASAGRVHRATNMLHSMVYFVPEGDEEYVAAGLRPGRMGYFASRSAPMGAVGPEVVTATFYNFNPELVARQIPRAWTLVAPEQVLEARLRVADRALRRLLGEEVIASRELAQATELLTHAALRCEVEGRALFAGHSGLAWPTATHLRFWHAVTLLREHRGDGHIVALVQAQLSGVEALVTHTATGRGFRVPAAKALRMWSDEQWGAAQEGLRARGLLAPDGTLTATGTALRERIERQTDELAAKPWEGVDLEAIDALVDYGKSLSRRIVAAGAFPDEVFAN
jgi:hypothetical protein